MGEVTSLLGFFSRFLVILCDYNSYHAWSIAMSLSLYWALITSWALSYSQKPDLNLRPHSEANTLFFQLLYVLPSN